jgi:hypothetical protein
MKGKHLFLVLSLIFSIHLSTSLSAQDFRAAVVNYMYVPEGMTGSYVDMEKQMAKPMHEEMIKQGHYDEWYLFAIPFPGGTNAEYHYATVHIYSSLEQMNKPSWSNQLFAKVHEGKDMDKATQWVQQSRDLVKSHRLMSWESFSAEDLEGPPSLLQIVYFKVPFDKQNAYEKMEREVFHPMHKKEIEMGKRAGWEGWWMQMPQGSGQAYSHIAVDMYKDWAQYTDFAHRADLMKTVHPDMNEEKMTEQFVKTVDMVKMEEWRLVDFAVKQE